MKYLWRFLNVEIQGKKFYIANNLFEARKDISKKIPLSYVRKLIDSMPSRCQMLCRHLDAQPSTGIQDHFLLTLVPFVILSYSM